MSRGEPTLAAPRLPRVPSPYSAVKEFRPDATVLIGGTAFDGGTPGSGMGGRHARKEAADDVCCLTLNYVFFSLQRSGRLEGGFERLWQRFSASRRAGRSRGGRGRPLSTGRAS